MDTETAAPAFFGIPNWRKFQHYHARKGTPPWIKLHGALMDDREFAALKPLAQWTLVRIWMLARETDGVIVNNPEYWSFRWRCRLKDFDTCGLVPKFLISLDALGNPIDASTMLDQRQRQRQRQKRGEAQYNGVLPIPSSKETDNSQEHWNLIVAEFQKRWNAMAKDAGLAKIKDMASREAKLKTRLKEAFFRDNWVAAIAAIPQVNWLVEGRKRGASTWKATPEWFLREGNVAKVLEQAERETEDQSRQGHIHGTDKNEKVYF